jgi:hypothetical protein
MNARAACALLIGAGLFLLLCAAVAPSAAITGPLPVVLPPEAGAGTALWDDRTCEAILQGFIILTGVFSILLLLMRSWRAKGGSP